MEHFGRTVYCPKCQGECVVVTAALTRMLTPARVSMDDLGQPWTQAIPLVYRRHAYKARCEQCGYEREFEEG